MVNKTELIKEVKAICLVDLDTKKLKEMSIEQLEELTHDLKIVSDSLITDGKEVKHTI